MPCHRHDGDPAGVGRLLQRAAQLEPVQARDGDVGDDRIRTQALRLLERLKTVVRVRGAESGVRQLLAVQGAGRLIVLDDQHQRRRRSRIRR